MKKLLILSLLAATVCLSATYTLIEDASDLPLLTPSLAIRETEKIRLDNGLEAYIIADPHADKAAIALTVKIGSWDEPADQPGLAHFLEHMLFMGTEKYPDENDFDRFLSDHGGQTNAFTTDGFTSYMFAVEPKAFDEALDRFSEFFKHPLFNPSGVGRELKAIDQEYAKNIENDDIREYSVLKELSKANHPFHSFSMGNSATLSTVERETLQTWYASHYDATVMRLTIIAPEALDAMREKVLKNFSSIENKKIERMPLTESAIDAANLAHIAYIEPIKNKRTLNIIWEMPPSLINLQSKPESTICAVLGDEGPSSLLALLKKEQLAEGITCGLMPATPAVQHFFIQVDLTKEGVEKVSLVIERIFQTFALLHQQETPLYLFEDFHRLATIRYQYQERLQAFDDIFRHAANQAFEPLDTYPQDMYVPEKYDAELTRKWLHFLHPENAFYLLTAPYDLSHKPFDRTEKWLGINYSLEAIPETQLALWAAAPAHPDIKIPAKNPFVPLSLALVHPQEPPSTPVPYPIALQADERGTVYFAPDQQFGLPALSIQLYFKTPYVTPAPRSSALADLYVNYVTEVLSASSYAAQTAGLTFQLKRDEFGVVLTLQGYNEKAPLLLEQILQAMKDPVIETERFFSVKQRLLDSYQNSKKEAPYLQGLEQLKNALTRFYAMPASKEKELEKITPEKLANFSKGLWKKAYVEGVVFGNLTEEQSKEMILLIGKTLNYSPFPKGKTLENKAISLPQEKGPYYLTYPVHVKGNAALLAVENGPFTYRDRAAQQIVTKAMEPAFFYMLRTQQQTGYLVANVAMEINRKLFSCFLVQSNTHEPRDLLARYELFFDSFLQELTKTHFTKERFESIKHSSTQDLRRPAKNQLEMTQLLFTIAFEHKTGFDFVEQRIKALENLSYEECIEWIVAQYGPTNKKRLGIFMKGNVSAEDVLNYQPLSSIKQLHKLSSLGK